MLTTESISRCTLCGAVRAEEMHQGECERCRRQQRWANAKRTLFCADCGEETPTHHGCTADLCEDCAFHCSYFYVSYRSICREHGTQICAEED